MLATLPNYGQPGLPPWFSTPLSKRMKTVRAPESTDPSPVFQCCESLVTTWIPPSGRSVIWYTSAAVIWDTLVVVLGCGILG